MAASLPAAFLLITHVLIPVVLFAWLARGRPANRVDWLLRVGAVGAYGAYFFVTGRWDWLGYPLRFIMLAGGVLAVGASAAAARGLPPWNRPDVKGWASLGAKALALLLLAFGIAVGAAGFRHPGNAVELVFPLRAGTYYVAQGGSSAVLNHHHPSRTQRYALDLVRLGRFGARARGLYPARLTDYVIFGDTLFSPCAGRIVQAVDGRADLRPPATDTLALAGNHVVIRHQTESVNIVLAHLLRGSLLVRSGDLVELGQAIGRVGNSGNTTEPHLHVHAVRAGSGGAPTQGEAVPLLFRGRFLERNSLVTE